LVKGNDAWSIAELVHAVVIMCHFHSMCGFVFGCGLLPDDDNTPVEEVINDITAMKKQAASRRTVLEGENMKVVETLNKIMGGDEGSESEQTQVEKKERPESREYQLPVGVYSNLNNYECFAPPPYASRTHWSTIPTKEELNDPSLKSISSRKHHLSLDRYIGDSQFSYTDFDVKSKDYGLLSAQEYNWKEHAYTMLNRFYNGSADLLDREFEVIYNLTENKFHKVENIDTSAFRSAIWFYVHRLYGMLHDDFNYTNINRLLNINLKKYVKTVTCYPERTKREQWIDMGFELRAREKVHVNMICTEARKQMELCYGLQVINAYMTKQYSH
jgi:sestrin